MKQRDRRRAGWVLAAFFVIIWTGGLLRTSAAKETVPETGHCEFPAVAAGNQVFCMHSKCS